MNFDKLGTSKIYNQARELPPETWELWKKTMPQAIPKKEIKSIADLGCGSGRFLNFLQKTYAAKVFGVDPSKKMLREAKQMAGRNKRIKLLKGSAEAIPLKDKSVDLIFISLAFHHFNKMDKAMKEIKRILRPQGLVAVRQPTKESNAKEQVLKFFPEGKKISDSLVTTRKEM